MVPGALSTLIVLLVRAHHASNSSHGGQRETGVRTSRSGSIPSCAFVTISATIAVTCGDDDDSGDESAATETSTPAPAGTGSVAPETTSGSVTTESTAATTESTEPTVTTEPTEVACSEDESTPPATQQLGEAEQLDGGSTFQETVTSLTMIFPDAVRRERRQHG